ncbi:unnamed protein product [Chrysodeixis includens]|uniref:Uncharacterized protein n=1 Tax=Chrysodeixis includens TaxID=689277 RepID=A0A9N8L5K2_CHRIL|nr:unnamed protein product [Chrysodeixis includens]
MIGYLVLSRSREPRCNGSGVTGAGGGAYDPATPSPDTVPLHRRRRGRARSPRRRPRSHSTPTGPEPRVPRLLAYAPNSCCQRDRNERDALNLNAERNVMAERGHRSGALCEFSLPDAMVAQRLAVRADQL